MLAGIGLGAPESCADSRAAAMPALTYTSFTH